MRQQGPGDFFLGLWLDHLHHGVVGSRGHLDPVASKMPHQLVPHALVSVEHCWLFLLFFIFNHSGTKLVALNFTVLILFDV
jgi:hypothetical protein